MTTQEAIKKLKNYDELEGKYNEALARIDEYERERKEIADKTNKALENPGVFTDRKTLTEVFEMLTATPTYLDDEIKVGDVVERNGRKGIVIYIYENDVFGKVISVFPLVCPASEVWEINENVQKTGQRYPQINEILANLSGGNSDVALMDIANIQIDNAEIKEGDIVKDKRDGEIGIYVGMGPDRFEHILVFRYNDQPDDQFFDAFLLDRTDYWIKTGKSCPQMAEILAAVKGEGENDEIAD